MATIQAVILRLQDREMKKKQKRRGWVSLLPSYQDMESLLFDMLMTGFVLLTLALSFGFFTIDNFFAQHLAHKTAFSIISWLVYGSLINRTLEVWLAWPESRALYTFRFWSAGTGFYWF